MSKTINQRNKYLNETLMRCKNGAHEDKAGKHVKRSKMKEQLRREIRDTDD